MSKIYYATSNPVKFAEAEQFFQCNLTTVSLQHYAEDILEIQTLDQELIAINKAQQAWHRLQRPVLAEDAGIFLCKYNQFPGTLTKFIYQAIGMEGLFKLVEPNDKAVFQLHLVYYYGPDQYHVFKSVCSGAIKKPAAFNASKSVPFDDIFVPDGSTQTYYELRKNNQLHEFNYRAKALEQFVNWYKNFIV